MSLKGGIRMNMERDDTKSPFGRELGIELLERREGYAKASLKVQENHLNTVGTAHGGVVFSLADSVFALCCNYKEVVVAVNVSVNYMSPARAGDVLVAEGWEIKRTRKFSFCKIEIKKGDEIVATMQALGYVLG